MNYEQKDNSGVLFHEKNKKSEKGPDYRGTCVVNGVALEIAGWKKTSQKGTNYLSMTFQPPRTQENKAAAKRLEEMDDPVPF